MGIATTHLISDEEYLNMPDYPGKQELLDGELINLPPAKRRHSKIVMRLQKPLESVLGPERVSKEEGYKLRRGWLIPDLSVTWSDQREGEWFIGAPMIAIEIVSRGNTAEEIERKVATYLEEGAAEVWVLYPKTRTMIVFRKNETIRVTAEYRCEIVPVTIHLASLMQ